MAYLDLYQRKFSQLIYANPLKSREDVRDFTLEGDALISFPDGRMRMENAIDPRLGQQSNFVYWCPKSFPADFLAQWKFWPLREPGLCIVFFSAQGRNGEDLFEPTLEPRTGEYKLYHHGDINAYHISYFRRRWPEERAFHLCNLRKSYGFHMVAKGADPIPSVEDAEGPYEISVVKDGAKILFFINELEVFTWSDDGKKYGPVLLDGKIGFRQMAPLMAEYEDLRVFGLSSLK